jgi:hypothetical protein
MGLYFAVKLTEADRALLEELQEFFGGIGRIYTVVPRAAPTSRSGFTKTASYYRVTRRSDLIRIVEHFDRYPLKSLKREAYAIWREMVLVKQEFRKPNRDVLEILARRLSASSPRNQPWR